MAWTPPLYSTLPLPGGRTHFRLLQIDNGETNEQLNLNMTVHDLGSIVEYEALSYCWGSTAPHHTAIVNGEEVKITDELDSALLQLRAEQKNTGSMNRIWVDAICIDQDNVHEKSDQINIMRTIYASASSVRAWLGTADEHTAISFEVFAQFAEADGTPNGSSTRDKLRYTPGTRTIALTATLDRPYFERVWIVQELVVARSALLQCGSHQIDFDAFQLAVRRMTGSGSYAFTQRVASLAYLGDWRDAFRRGDQTELGLRLLIDSRDRKATDLRDKLYSLWGIVSDEIAQAIVVNYDKSTEEVYTAFSSAILQASSDLQILSAVELGHRERSTLRLPSYVPDFSEAKLGHSILQRYRRFKPAHLFAAASAERPSVNVVTGGVEIRGFEVDSIDQVLDIRPVPGVPALVHDIDSAKLRDLASRLVSSDHYAFTGEAAWVATFRTLSADRTTFSPRVCDTYRTQYLSQYPGQSISDDIERVAADLPQPMWYALSSAIASVVIDKALFVTKNGYIGLGHDGIQVGDKLCILYGGEVPFLLRATSPGECYTFLCEAYVHGLMDGEALAGHNSKVDKYFTLR